MYAILVAKSSIIKEFLFLSSLLIDLQGKNLASTPGDTKNFVKSPIFCIILDHPGKNLLGKIILSQLTNKGQVYEFLYLTSSGGKV